MMDAGFWELLLVGAIVLLVAGPERLPGIARTAGQWVGRAKVMFHTLKTQFTQELHDMETRQQSHSDTDSASTPHDQQDTSHEKR